MPSLYAYAQMLTCFAAPNANQVLPSSGLYSNDLPPLSSKDGQWAEQGTFRSHQNEMTGLLDSLLQISTGGIFVDASHLRDDSAGNMKVRFLSSLPSVAGLCIESDPRVAERLRNEVNACRTVFNGYPAASNQTEEFVFVTGKLRQFSGFKRQRWMDKIRSQLSKTNGAAMSVAPVHTAAIASLIPADTKQVDWLYLDANHGDEDAALLGLDLERTPVLNILFGNMPPSPYAEQWLKTFNYGLQAVFPLSPSYTVFLYSRLSEFMESGVESVNWQNVQFVLNSSEIFSFKAHGLSISQSFSDFSDREFFDFTNHSFQSNGNLQHFTGPYRMIHVTGLNLLLQRKLGLRVFLNGASHCSSSPFQVCDTISLRDGLEEFSLFIDMSFLPQHLLNLLRIVLIAAPAPGQTKPIAYEGILTFASKELPKTHSLPRFCPSNEILCVHRPIMYISGKSANEQRAVVDQYMTRGFGTQSAGMEHNNTYNLLQYTQDARNLLTMRPTDEFPTIWKHNMRTWCKRHDRTPSLFPINIPPPMKRAGHRYGFITDYGLNLTGLHESHEAPVEQFRFFYNWNLHFYKHEFEAEAWETLCIARDKVHLCVLFFCLLPVVCGAAGALWSVSFRSQVVEPEAHIQCEKKKSADFEHITRPTSESSYLVSSVSRSRPRLVFWRARHSRVAFLYNRKIIVQVLCGCMYTCACMWSALEQICLDRFLPVSSNPFKRTYGTCALVAGPTNTFDPVGKPSGFNAAEGEQQLLGEEIDKHELVIRLNFQPTGGRLAPLTGTKTDIVVYPDARSAQHIGPNFCGHHSNSSAPNHFSLFCITVRVALSAFSAAL